LSRDFKLYFSTTSNIIWTILWLLLVRDSPDNHPFITTEEKLYIIQKRTKAQKKGKFSAPFGAILMSVPFWAIVMAHWTSLWSGVTCSLSLTPFSFRKYIILLDVEVAKKTRYGQGCPGPYNFLFCLPPARVARDFFAASWSRPGPRLLSGPKGTLTDFCEKTLK